MKKNLLKKIPANSIMKRLLFPMLLLIIIQSVCVLGIFLQSGLIKQLRTNSVEILQERVNNSRTYLENTMINNWSNVTQAAQLINQTTEEYINSKRLGLDFLDHNTQESIELMNQISSDLIAMLRNNNVTGAFLVFNHSNLEQDVANNLYQNKTGLYIRDMDPNGMAASNSDLLLECAPVAMVRHLGISTSSTWEPMYNFNKNQTYYPFLYKTYQNAVMQISDSEAMPDLLNMGYWSPAYYMNGNSSGAISYSVPLLLGDGTVYGVLGVEINLDYLKTFLPYTELFNDKKGSYIFAIGNKENLEFQDIMVNGSSIHNAKSKSSTSVFEEKELDGRKAYYLQSSMESPVYTSIQYLNLYNSNTSFSGERWAVIGAVQEDDLFAFSNQIQNLLWLCILITFVIGVGAVVSVSFLISKPIMSLADEMEQTDPHKGLKLGRLKIKEIDQLSETLEKLSQDVIESGNKFTRIMEMSSAKLAGFELEWEQKSVFITERFFDIFGLMGIDESKLSMDEFIAYMRTLSRYYQPGESHNNEYVFKIHTAQGNSYVRLTVNDDGKRCYGLAEDVTRIIKERQIIEHERDYDLLTGLINRRAFRRVAEALFAAGAEQLKTALLVMLDLDNLKQINDNYGHDCGDRYIQAAAEVFKNNVPSDTVISRISGDEFYLFFHGYENKQDILNHLYRLKSEIDHTLCELPGKRTCPLRISGGYAWYPQDSTSYLELLRFSDFAMYKVKQNNKGDLAAFDRSVYDSEVNLIQNKSDLTKLIDDQAILFYFQPIVDAHTGAIYAYEALMRSSIPALHMPMDILHLAQMEHKLNQIEILTWFKALEAFDRLTAEGIIAEDCKVFINSIADQVLPAEKINLLVEQYHPLLNRVVMEMTEEQRMNNDLREMKMRIMRSLNSGIALDDFGAGYNSEKNLLEINPDYVKVDISIIRNINKDRNKQMLFQNIVMYAHKDGMKVVAEGIENYEEMRKCIDLGADFLQGFYLARPAEIPLIIPEEKIKEIRTLQP